LQHIEFLDRSHFELNYHRIPAPVELSHFIDFFWETNFDHLWKQHPEGFSDVLFANTGYTYLINLGTPFVMQVGEKKFDMRTDGYLPRHRTLECFHQKDNRLFGIKFRVSPILFIKEINFSEYREYIFPLSYLLDALVIDQIKTAGSFSARVDVLTAYFNSIILENSNKQQPVTIVTTIMTDCDRKNDFNISIEELASQYGISSRTLQRYFETCTGIGSKPALQVMRIRKATEQLVNSPGDFHYSKYGYYDYSHFSKHLRSFLKINEQHRRNLHLEILAQSGK